MTDNKRVAAVAAGIFGAAALGYALGRRSTPVSKEAKTPCRWAAKKVDTGLKEFSVIYTDRAVNMLSQPFVDAMKHISKTLKHVYQADSVALIPGSGTYAMESCARQFGTDKKMLIIRNGYFSYRWTDILEVTGISGTADASVVMKAKVAPGQESEDFPHFSPLPIEEIRKKIEEYKPAVVFAPHVETSTGIILSDAYLKEVADAAHSVGALFVLDCVASGTVWVDMKKTGVDAIISAPQKGWTGPACCGLVMLSKHARDVVFDDKKQPESNSFCCNLRKWCTVMESYEANKAMYYTTLPTDALMMWRDVLIETEAFGFEKSKDKIQELGRKIRAVLESNGFKSVAAPGFKAPGVVVSYSKIPGMGAKFKANGLQIAGGVPFKLGEEKLFNAREKCFRIGLFGLDKNKDVDGTVKVFEDAVKKIVASYQSK